MKMAAELLSDEETGAAVSSVVCLSVVCVVCLSVARHINSIITRQRSYVR